MLENQDQREISVVNNEDFSSSLLGHLGQRFTLARREKYKLEKVDRFIILEIFPVLETAAAQGETYAQWDHWRNDVGPNTPTTGGFTLRDVATRLRNAGLCVVVPEDESPWFISGWERVKFDDQYNCVGQEEAVEKYSTAY